MIKKKILLFSDVGIDDSIAMMYALYHPNIELVGIVAEYGNVSQKDTVRNTFYILDLADRLDIPVIAGATRPLIGENPTFYPGVHGTEGLGPFQPPDKPYSLLNFDEVFKLIEKYGDELFIVTIGRCTSLAAAFILGGEVMQKVKHIYVMGGAFLVPGNVTAVAEANIYADPTAANIVISHSASKVVNLLPLNVTNYAVLTPQMAAQIDKQKKTKLGNLIKPMFDYYYHFYKGKMPSLGGSPLHDLLTVCAVVNPHLFQFVVRPVMIEEQEGPARGMSIADFREKPEIDHTQSNACYIALQFQYEAFITDFLQVMKQL